MKIWQNILEYCVNIGSTYSSSTRLGPSETQLELFICFDWKHCRKFELITTENCFWSGWKIELIKKEWKSHENL